VRFTVDAYPSTTFQGSVTQIRKAPINVQNVITYDMVVAVSNPDLKLFPGMTANVKILTNQADNVLRVPNSALRFRPAEAKQDGVVRAAGRKQDSSSAVWILGADGKPQQVKVKLGITDGYFTSIESGDLKAGDAVITSSQMKNGSVPASAPRGPQGPRF